MTGRFRIGSLFSGIGGLECGLEQAGLGKTIWQVEIDEYCRRVLARHWPKADRSITDVASHGALVPVDLICGGFPCQRLSVANQTADSESFNLWSHYARIVKDLQPSWVIVENVQHTWRRWVPRVRSDLAQLGYASLPLRLSAADVGAWHRRRRIFILAHTNGVLLRQLSRRWSGQSRALAQESRRPARWPTPPGLPRVAHGLSDRVDRQRAIGNAVVVECGRIIGELVLNSDSCSLAHCPGP